MWTEQGDKQVEQTLGWAASHVRADVAIRRHGHLVSCALAFYWWAEAHTVALGWEVHVAAGRPVPDAQAQEEQAASALRVAGRTPPRRTHVCHRTGLLVGGAPVRAGLAGARVHAVALLAGVVGHAPTARLAMAPGVAVGGSGLISTSGHTTNCR
jgi:hypothetical protein